jgi:hypothetical protein
MSSDYQPHPLRIQRHRFAGWRMPEGAVYVGRPTFFGNPWSETAARASELFVVERIPEVLVENYRSWLDHGDRDYRGKNGDLEPFEVYIALHERRRKLLERLPELRGKQLACWCSLDRPCHADVLCELANGSQ